MITEEMEIESLEEGDQILFGDEDVYRIVDIGEDIMKIVDENGDVFQTNYTPTQKFLLIVE
jgi:sorbitol-specific phosphotransferase system component IIA